CSSGGGSDPSGGGGDDDVLRDGDRLDDAIGALYEAIGTDEARATDVTLYPGYVIVEAQDPDAADHIDRYTWRDGDVGDPEPVHLTGPQADVELRLFALSAVPWRDLAELAARAEDRLETAEPTRVEEPHAGYVVVRRSTGGDDRPLTISVYVEGPRRSGYVEFSPQGEVLTASVS
ncbi:MAG TPA: hypothetical protein VF743_01290, partial [Acidimicrobiales bacterium]